MQSPDRSVMHRLGIAVGVVVVLAVTARVPAPARVADRAGRCGSVPHARGWRTRTVGAIQGVDRYISATALALGRGGRATAFWADRAGVRAARRAGHWRRARTLDAKAEPFGSTWFAASPSGAFDAGWRSSPTGDDATINVLAGRAGAALSRPQIVSHDTRHSDRIGVLVAAVAADGGAAETWIDRRPLQATMVVTTREPGAARFGHAFPLGIGEDFGTALAAGPSGRGFLATMSGDAAISLVERPPGGRWAGTPQTATFPRGVYGLVGAAIGAAGQAILVGGGRFGGLWAVARASNAAAFGPARPLSTGAKITEAVMTPTPSGGATVAWTERRGAARTGHVRVAHAPAGGSFGPAADFRGVAVTPRNLSLAALDDGSALATWTLDCGDHRTQVLIGRRDAGGGVSQRVISDVRARPVPPAAALDSAGHMGVLWATRRPNGRPVFRVSLK
jgi:hypothetical protein